jgi:hypothetical protein
MRSLLFNLVARARRMLILRDANLTYHYGDDRGGLSQQSTQNITSLRRGQCSRRSQGILRTTKCCPSSVWRMENVFP